MVRSDAPALISNHPVALEWSSSGKEMSDYELRRCLKLCYDDRLARPDFASLAKPELDSH